MFPHCNHWRSTGIVQCEECEQNWCTGCCTKILFKGPQIDLIHRLRPQYIFYKRRWMLCKECHKSFESEIEEVVKEIRNEHRAPRLPSHPVMPPRSPAHAPSALRQGGAKKVRQVHWGNVEVKEI